MTLVRYYPELKNIYRTIGRNNVWNPAVDIIEDNDIFLIELDLPGFKKSDFTITVKEGVLTLNGERKRKESEDGEHYRYFERPVGAFERSFRLPEHVDGEKVKASYKNGVLKLELPKKEEARPHTIQITE